ncbi:hypothetical protein NZD85_08275 [Empedobacter stercoris]|uniref:hypothetical protein n=1 Tax=Empedobacter stercoris TaxID=1628248 RepID=UPI0021AF1A77|nr:hypothetical protein [Empedobacter stercoris]UWX65901.1 hypothetical protein NZD85_08275 [Empedobacter stercoris]
MKSKITLFLLSLSFFIIGFIIYYYYAEFVSNFFSETNNIVNTSPNPHFIDRWLFCLGMAIIPLVLNTFKTKKNIILSLSLIIGLITIFASYHVNFINENLNNLTTFDSSNIKIGLFFTLGIISAYLIKILIKNIK